jgi:flotillin
MTGFGLAAVSIVVLAGVAIAVTIMRLLYVCQPSEVLVFSGRRRRGRDHNFKGYRVIRGGRALKTPLFERVDRIDLTNMIVDVSVQNAYSKGGIPLTVQGVANIKVPGEEPLLNNALERFLGQDRKYIQKVAQDTLEGNLRGVLATLTPEEVNQDKERFATQLAGEAETDFSRLGLVLDTLKIQNVSDQVGYLDAIGRQRSAEIRRDALIAEASARAEAAEQKWRNTMNGELSQLDAQIQIARKENERRIVDAQSRREAEIAGQRAQVGAAVAEAQAQVETQTARCEQVRLQLEADVIQPAEAARRKAEEAAKADASRLIQQGKATAQVLEELAQGFLKSGEAGRDALLMQKLLPVMEMLAKVGALNVDRLTLLAQSAGPAGAGAAGETRPLAALLADYNAQIQAATGVDVAALMRAKSGQGGGTQ